jgi:hypothetical protein
MNLPKRFAWKPSTQHIPVWDPYQETAKIPEVAPQYVYILGPKKKGDVRDAWLFRFITSQQPFSLVSLHTDKEGFPCIQLQINREKATIQYINQCDPYSGIEQMEWVIQIVRRIGIPSIVLQDSAYKECNRADMPIPLSLVRLLWRGQTYYEIFGFRSKNSNQKNSVERLHTISEKLGRIGWEDFEKQIQETPYYEEFYELYGNHSKGPFDAFSFFMPDQCQPFYNFLSLYQTRDNVPLKSEYQELIRILTKNSWVLPLAV